MAVTAAATSSPFVGAVEPVTATDEEIREALEAAEIPPLLPALAYATGDLSLLQEDLRPDPLTFSLPQGGLSEVQLERARQLAFDALVRFRDGGSQPAPAPSDEDLLRILEFAVGGVDMAAYLPLLEEE